MDAPATPVRLDNRVARRLFLHRHLLIDPPTGNPGRDNLLGIVRHLGFVQVDSVNTVARAHDMILFARQQSYRPAHLRRLVDRDRALWEHWTHDASVLPVEYFPYWRHRFARNRATLADRWEGWQGTEYLDHLDSVLDHIRAEGAALCRDVGEGGAGGGWWEWKPAKTAMEYLWHTGDLAVCHRRGFQKAYDLAERVIPAEYHAPRHPPEAVIDWACRSALDKLGFATSGEIAAFLALVTPDEAKAWVAAQTDLVPVIVEGIDGSPRKCWALPGIAARLAAVPEPGARIRVLSPFDPALRDRKRAERLFGFAYRIEIYVPEDRRKYGYYVFPVLEADRLIGRIDMRTDRDTDALAVRAFWPEPGVRMGQGRRARLDAELSRMATFAGVARVTYADGWLRDPA